MNTGSELDELSNDSLIILLKSHGPRFSKVNKKHKSSCQNKMEKKKKTTYENVNFKAEDYSQKLANNSYNIADTLCGRMCKIGSSTDVFTLTAEGFRAGVNTTLSFLCHISRRTRCPLKYKAFLVTL